jgi:hypothetical protein
MLNSALRIAELLFARHIAICRVTDGGLLISDRPLTLYQSPGDSSPLRGVGFGTADEIWIPLNRRTIAMMHSHDQIGDRILNKDDAPTAAELNAVMVANTFQELYCHPDDVADVLRLQLPGAGRPLMAVHGGDFIKGSTDGVNRPPERQRPYRYRRP